MAVEFLHTGALALVGVGACCVAVDRPRARVRELALGILMFLAMGDILLWHVVAPVWWGVVVLAASVVSVIGAPRRRSAAAGERGIRAMDALGGVLMAALMLLMTGSGGSAGDVHAGHGASAGLLTAILVVATLAYVAGSVHMAFWITPSRGSATATIVRRLPVLAMSASMLLMAAAVLF